MPKSNLKRYWVKIPECKIDTCTYEPTPKKAAKTVFKDLIEKRGWTHFNFDNRQFVSPTAFVNYLEKKGWLDRYVHQDPSPI